MDESQLKEAFRKFLSQDEKSKQNEELRAHGPMSGIVQAGNHPEERLRRTMRRMFPGYPDVFDLRNDDRD